jgi:2-hydroxy-6-oxonona-2,4-dienedioate hydrolase
MSENSFWVHALGAQVRYYDAGGFRTRCIEAGSGEPIVLLHGISGHAETWVRNVTTLARTHHVYALDMLGHGFTDKPLIDYTVPALAEHVLAFLDAVDAPRAVLVGQSLGGWVAGWLAAHHADRVSAFVSVTGAGLQVDAGGAALTRQVGSQVREATKKAFAQPSREAVRTRLEWLVHDKAVVTDELVEARYRIFTQPDFLAVANRLLDGLTEGESHALGPEALTRISCPTLVLWTRHNPTMQWPVGEAASKLIPGASFHLMEDVAHWPQFEDPEEFHRVVGEFLGRVVPRPAAMAES